MRERWNTLTREYDTSPRVDAFLEELDALCRKHNLAIEHEDCHGAFVIVDKGKFDWIQAAGFRPEAK